jgi:hypothetical protein
MRLNRKIAPHTVACVRGRNGGGDVAAVFAVPFVPVDKRFLKKEGERCTWLLLLSRDPGAACCGPSFPARTCAASHAWSLRMVSNGSGVVLVLALAFVCNATGIGTHEMKRKGDLSCTVMGVS